MPPSNLAADLPAAHKDKEHPGNAERVYPALCRLLSGRGDEVDWASFSPADWARFARRAEAEGVAPLAYHFLSSTFNLQPSTFNSRPSTFNIPNEVWSQLKASYYRTAAHNALLLRELERILEAFERAGIEVIVLKGAALAQTIYPDPALRPMSDIDLLVHAGDLAAASKAAQGTGYTQEKITYHAYLRGGPEQQVAVEIHWALPQDSRGRSPDLDTLWRNTVPLEKSGNPAGKHTGEGTKSPYRQAKQLTPEAAFLYLVGHLMLQTAPQRRRLLWFYDLYRLYQGPLHNLDWNTCLKSRLAAPWADWVRVTLYQLRDLFGIALPALLTASPPPALSTQSVEITTRQYIRNAWAQLDRRSRLRMGLAICFPDRAYLQWRYRIRHRWLWPLYLPRRWWEMGRYWAQNR